MELLYQLRKTPFLRIVIPFLAGLAAGHYCLSPGAILIVFSAGAVFLIFIFSLNTGKPLSYKYTWAFGLLLYFIFFILGAGHLLSVKYLKGHYALSSSVCLTGRLIIMDTPEIRSGSVRALARIDDLSGHDQPQWLKTKAVIIFHRNTRSESLGPGDIILVRARFLPVPGPSNPGEFDYKSYLSRHDTDYQVFAADKAWMVAGNSKKNLKIMAVNCREGLLKKLRASCIDHRAAAVLSALTLGYKSDLGDETIATFTRAGVVHVMALSGFNVGIIYLMIYFCLGFLRNNRILVFIRLLVSLAAIWSFVIITGLSSSVTRAGVMLSIYVVGKFVNRDAHPLNILSASAFIMLVFSPFCFLDVGFQLSFAAVFGLIYFQPWLYRLITFKYWLPRKIWMLFTASIAAQLATAPFVLYYFHQFPLFFWITNLYVIPLVSLIIYLSVLFFFLSVFEPTGFMLAGVLELLVCAMLEPLDWLGNFPGALADGIFIGRLQVVLLFALLITTGLFILHSRSSFALQSMGLLFLFLLINGHRLYAINKQQIITVSNMRGTGIMNIIAGRSNFVFSSGEKPLPENVVHYSFRNWWIEKGVYKMPVFATNAHMNYCRNSSWTMRDDIIGRNVFLCFSGVSFVIYNDDTLKYCSGSPKIKTDYLIITKDISPEINSVLDHFETGMVIIDSNVDYYISKKWTSLCRMNGISCWPVREKGAFVLKIR